MYAAGPEHPSKAPSTRFLERVGSGEVEAAIDAEVLQEILHRYRALRRWDEGRRIYDLTRRIVPLVVPITSETTDEARSLLDRYPHLMARDALHAAAVRLAGATALVSYDRDFDSIEGFPRREP